MRNILVYLSIGLGLVGCGDGGSSGNSPALTTAYYFNYSLDGSGDGAWVEHKLRSDGYYEQKTIYYTSNNPTSTVVWIGDWVDKGTSFDAKISIVNSDGFCPGALPRVDVFTYATFQHLTSATAPPISPTLTTCP